MKKKLSPNIGLYSVYMGVFILLLCHFTGWKQFNAILLAGLTLIIIGIVAYILLHKTRGRY